MKVYTYEIWEDGCCIHDDGKYYEYESLEDAVDDANEYVESLVEQGFARSIDDIEIYYYLDGKEIYLMEYKGKKYPVREVEIPGWGTYLVGVMSLENELLTPDYDYVDDIARYIDEKIFYYVDDDEINREDLGEFVAKNCI